MNWLNIELPTLRSEEYLGSDPVQRATWLNLMAFCADQENGGTISDCSDWGGRRWLQLLGVTKDEVCCESNLWSWNGDDLTVWSYPKAKEAEVRAKREAGKKGGRPPKTKAKKPDGYDLENHEVQLSKREAETERKGKEGNKNIDCRSDSEQAGAAKQKQEELYADFLSRFNLETGRKKRVMDGKARRQLNARLKEGFTVDEIINAAKHASQSEYHRKNKQYLTPEFITRDDKLSMYMREETAKNVFVANGKNNRGESLMDGLTREQWKEKNNVSS